MSGTDNTTRIILVRHGHVEGILPERFRGRRDVDLSELGVRQAQATAQRIAGQWTPAIVYTSPLKRCVQTAAAIATACKSSWTALELRL
jgi:phosphoserine phosphatase